MKSNTPFDALITSVRKLIDAFLLGPSSSSQITSQIRYTTGLVSLYVELTLKTGFRCNTERGKADLTRTIRAAMEVRQAGEKTGGGVGVKTA